MKKILIAYDGTPGAEAAMEDMARGGFPASCEAKVFTVADVWLPPAPDSGEPPFPERPREAHIQAHQHALEAVAAARATSVRGAERLRVLFPAWTIHHASHADSPAWGILAEARRWSADLVVIGSHGRSPLQKFFLGSVSQKVAAEAPCSVRVYREQRERRWPVLRVLVALDTSEDSEAAFRELLGRAWQPDTEFQLVTTMDARLKSSAIMDAGTLVAEDTHENAEEWVSAMLADRVGQLEARGFTAGSHLLEGDPKQQILRYAQEWNADCIFLGARGIQHGARLYLGTVASAIASRAHCTVEIVRTEAPKKSASPG